MDHPPLFRNCLDETIVLELGDAEAALRLPPQPLETLPADDAPGQRPASRDPDLPYVPVRHVFTPTRYAPLPPIDGHLIVPDEVAAANRDRPDLFAVDRDHAWRDEDGLHVAALNRYV